MVQLIELTPSSFCWCSQSAFGAMKCYSCSCVCSRRVDSLLPPLGPVRLTALLLTPLYPGPGGLHFGMGGMCYSCSQPLLRHDYLAFLVSLRGTWRLPPLTLSLQLLGLMIWSVSLLCSQKCCHHATSLPSLGGRGRWEHDRVNLDHLPKGRNVVEGSEGGDLQLEEMVLVRASNR